MGAVGAIAPTIFESVGASTHGFGEFCYQSSILNRKDLETIGIQ